MKRLLSLGVLSLLAISIVLASPGYSFARGGHSAGWFVGGLALGTFIGSTARPYYGPTYVYPAPAYVYRAPVYAYPEPVYVVPELANRAYAYPDPSYTAKPEAPPAGEWVVVPGQWVNGKWVPEHKAWIGNN
jgi:hypothetical protein